jgi:hypothetical protein
MAFDIVQLLPCGGLLFISPRSFSRESYVERKSQPLPPSLGFRSTGGIPFQRATKTVRMEMICRSFKHSSQMHADNFVPLPYQPENNDIPVKPKSGANERNAFPPCVGDGR